MGYEGKEELEDVDDMIRKSLEAGTKVFHAVYGIGWWLDRPEYTRVEYEGVSNGKRGNLLIPRKDLTEIEDKP